MSLSTIEWTEATWNPVTGCSKVSAGCLNCYAERMAFRLQAMGQVASVLRNIKINASGWEWANHKQNGGRREALATELQEALTNEDHLALAHDLSTYNQNVARAPAQSSLRSLLPR